MAATSSRKTSASRIGGRARDDNDGYVGGKDYVVAKQFDKDGDGKLNEEERKAAFEAIAKVCALKANNYLGLREKLHLERGGTGREQTL